MLGVITNAARTPDGTLFAMVDTTLAGTVFSAQCTPAIAGWVSYTSGLNIVFFRHEYNTYSTYSVFASRTGECTDIAIEVLT
jgi:hypothetical protein